MRSHRKYFKPTITYVDGIKFDSKAEARRYSELKMLERAGVIKDIKLHPKFPMIINNIKIGRGWWTGDFRYMQQQDGVWFDVIEDVKSIDTRESKIRRDVCAAINGIKITVVER